ncbi:ABC transporter substrate-binding protein [Agromyces archimandritae]|uniref:Extracellular solute-binding protein n=1 Tax=Agromyces archimandritae TaxID=2781962 RepID=A0A975FMF0_9MICO|nr:extracellular solute-binding protein [Agromyces archimandritae]QTX04397.1 extracellular solute-binding protein [Agromyces archimandritae]
MDLKKTASIGLAGMAAAALLLTGCADTGGAEASQKKATTSEEDIALLGGKAAAAELDDLYGAAVDAGEGTVTIYGPSDQALADAGLYRLFEERYPGIAVNIVTTFGAEMDQKVTNEAASGNGLGDVVHTGTTVIKWADSGLLEPFTPVGAAELPEGLADGEGRFFGNQFGAIGFMVNTSKIDVADAPQSWAELPDSRYGGELAMTSPTGAGSLSDIISTLMYAGELDRDGLQELKDNKPLVVGSTDLVVQAVVSGERPVGIGIGMTAYLKAKEAGAPVDFVFPMEGRTPVVVTNVGILASAPNPNAAKLLAAWLLTPEAAAGLPAGGLYGVLPDSPAPEGFPTLADAEVLLPPPAEEIPSNSKKTLDALSEIFGG